jgi:hypothetical protein
MQGILECNLKSKNAHRTNPDSGECASGGDLSNAARLLWIPIDEIATDMSGCAACNVIGVTESW